MPDDIVAATTSSISEKINGVDRVFRYLNTYDKAAIIRKMRADAKAVMLSNLKTAGASSEQTLVDLNAFDADPPSNWVAYVQEYEGMTYAFQLSLEKSYPGEGEKLARESDISHERNWEILYAICGLVKKEESAPDPKKQPDTRTYGDGGDDPNPTFAPLTYGTAGATNPTPTPT